MDRPPPHGPGRRTLLAALGTALAAGVGCGDVRRAAPDRRAATGLAAAPQPATPQPDAAPTPRPVPGPPKRQMRGLWITSLHNADWPAARGLPPERSRADLTTLLDQAVAIGFNAAFLQVRPTADALWPSPYEPWTEWLTGAQGRDPGWDPLAFAVEAAHERGLALHAWFNPFRVAIQPDPAKLLPSHPARRNPGWLVRYNGELYYDPGLPEVRAFVQQAIMDAVLHYDLDGVHFDDYFYPYPGPQDFPDHASFAAHGGGFRNRAAWRRRNIDLMVRQTQQLIRAARPEVVYGVSPFGVWRNRRTDPRGSATTALVQSYDSQYSDTLGWAREGWIDYIAPQLYWYFGYELADYALLAPWWAEQTAGTDTQLWIGQSASRPGAPERPGPWQDPAELSRHLALNATLPAIGGDILFSARAVQLDRIGAVRKLAAEHWQRPALRPLLPRLAHGTPPGPPGLSPVVPWRGVLRVVPGAGPQPFQYALYRYDDYPGPIPPADPDHLVALLPALTTDRYRLPPEAPGAWHAATAIDRAGRESGVGRPVRFTP
ncbi:family 10 glycosylhydrolase [Kitasatospora sp. NBC_01266]|nr:family 10 glycosylhydrolase [Kitasatospora sp. NBC_01266]